MYNAKVPNRSSDALLSLKFEGKLPRFLANANLNPSPTKVKHLTTQIPLAGYLPT